MYDIIVIGAGTAGLSAAIYAVRAGKSVLVLEGKSYGGQIINTPSVENYPGIKNVSGFEFATNLYEQAIELGAKVEYEKVIKIIDEEDTKLVVIDGKYSGPDVEKESTEIGTEAACIVTEEGHKAYRCKSVIIATGTVNRKLGIDRENELVGRGVSYCATCDGAFYRGKDVAVVGGGSTALEDAAFLSNYCNKVYLIHRRNEFRGEDTLVKALESKENVEFVLSSKVVKIDGDVRLESIGVENIVRIKEEVSAFDSGLQDVKGDTHRGLEAAECIQDNVVKAVQISDTESKIKSIDVEGLFIAIGQEPSNEIFRDIIALDDYGYIVATENCKTNMEGIFVAGDCRTKKVRQLTTAAADGAVAGLAACEYIG